MKTIVLILTILSVSVFSFAENDAYTKAMTAAIASMETANSSEDFQNVVNQFERIANVEKDEWLPNYYAAYVTMMMASSQKDPSKKDEGLDAAKTFLDKAAAVDHDQSEVLSLQGFIYMLKIGVDPATRGPEYSGKSGAALQKAMALNPDNPRAMFLLAQLTFGTAQFFGSDTSEACKQNEAALELFKADEKKADADPLAPKWGKSMAEGFKNRCQG